MQQEPVTPVVQAPPEPPPLAPRVETQSVQVDHSHEIEEIPIVQTETYISLGDKTQGIVEFDLMSHREKGQEVRYLHIQVRGFSLDEKGSSANTYMAIQSKDDFERIKKFFSTLKWED
jgi:hypothetical protein